MRIKKIATPRRAYQNDFFFQCLEEGERTGPDEDRVGSTVSIHEPATEGHAGGYHHSYPDQMNDQGDRFINDPSVGPIPAVQQR